jgi:hypothetical protein
MTEQTDMTIRDAVTRLAAARKQQADARAVVAAAEADFKAQHAEAFDALDAATIELGEADNIVRRLAIAVYEATGEQQLGFGVTVALGQKITYKEKDAIDWAKRTEAIAVAEVLDWKAFEKAAKAMDLPFVHRVVTPSVRVAQDLEAVLAEVVS